MILYPYSVSADAVARFLFNLLYKKEANGKEKKI